MQQNQQTEESFEADIEHSKLCSQETCRRVATHCSALMDALVIFKTWFVERQGELTAPEDRCSLSSKATCQGRMVPYNSPTACNADATMGGPVMLTDQSLLSERDWAVSRMRRMENQMGRLRNACIAMRVQLEAGLRYKTEADQVKRDLEMALTTISHYKSIIDEGNQLRDDLRSELATARKQASIARAQLQQQQRTPIHSSTPRPIVPDLTPDRTTDPSTATLLALAPDTDVAHLRTLLERQIRWGNELNVELVQLRQTVRRLTEEETERTEHLKTVRTYVQSVADQISGMETKRRRKPLDPPFGSVLSLQWLTGLAQHLSISLPANLARITVPVAPNANGSATQSHRTPSPPALRRRTKRGPNRGLSSPIPDAKRARQQSVSSTATQQSQPIPSPPPPSSHALPTGSEFLEQVLMELNEVFPDERDLALTSPRRSPPPPPEPPAPSIQPCSRSSPLAFGSTLSLSDSTDTASPIRIRSSSSGRVANRARRFKRSPSVDRRSSDVDLDRGEMMGLVDQVLETTEQQPEQPEVPPSMDQPTTEHIADAPTFHSSPSSLRPEATHHPPSSSTRSPRQQPPPPQLSSPRLLSSSSMRISDSEDYATRVLTCPSGYSRKRHSSPKPQPHTPPTSLLSLLESTYSTELIAWFDRITSEPLPNSLDDQSTSPTTTATADSRQDVIEPTRPHVPSEAVSLDLSATPASQPQIPTDSSDSSRLDKLCTAYFRSKANATHPPSTLLTLLRARPVDAQIQAVWSSFLSCLTSVRPADMDRRETQFVSLWITLGNRLSVMRLCDLFLSAAAAAESLSPVGLIVCTRCVFRLLVEANQADCSVVRTCFIRLLHVVLTGRNSTERLGLLYLPHVVDACPAPCWRGLQLIHDVATSPRVVSSSPMVVTTVQTLLAWCEAYHGKCQTLKTPPPVSNLPDLGAVFERLHSAGWLVGDRAACRPHSPTDAASQLSQQNGRIRSLALLLVDACLQVDRTAAPEVVLNLSDVRNIEAACALRLLLGAMEFVIGQDAVVPHEKDDSSTSAQVKSVTTAHQRKRRNRRADKQQQFGLLSWLVNGRLIPWLAQQAKLIRTSANSEACLLFGRLAVLITDILMLGTHPFTIGSTTPKLSVDLRSALFHAGRRLIQLVEQHARHVAPLTVWTCAVRLLAFAPSRCLSLAVCGHQSRAAAAAHQIHQSNLPITILWDSVDLPTLFKQSCALIAGLPDVPDQLVTSYKRTGELWLASL